MIPELQLHDEKCPACLQELGVNFIVCVFCRTMKEEYEEVATAYERFLKTKGLL